jgi:hypothetical protein
MLDYFGCWKVARENSSNDRLPSWFRSSWSNNRFAELSFVVSAAPVEPDVAAVLVDAFAPRGAIVDSLAGVPAALPEGAFAVPPDGVAVGVDWLVVAAAAAPVGPAGAPVVVSAALASIAPVTPTADTMSPETSLLLSRRIMVGSCGEGGSVAARDTLMLARSLPALTD